MMMMMVVVVVGSAQKPQDRVYELDVQNKWEETHSIILRLLLCPILLYTQGGLGTPCI